MDTKRMLYFLTFLSKNTVGCSGEIASLYKRVLDEEGDVVKAGQYLEDCYFDRFAVDLRDRANDILEKIYGNPANASELLPQLRQVIREMEQGLSGSKAIIANPLPTLENIHILKKRDFNACRSAMRAVANACVYLMLVYGGVERVRDLTWNDAAGLDEQMDAVNAVFLPKLMKLQIPAFGWIIRKKITGGRMSFGESVYELVYESAENMWIRCAGYHGYPMGTHAFYNVEAYESGRPEVPLCWGVGNITSCGSRDALSFLQEDVVTGLRSPNHSELKEGMPIPIECIRKLSDGRSFCVTPEELAYAMTRWSQGREIVSRENSQTCLICGERVGGGRLVCRRHFVS